MLDQYCGVCDANIGLDVTWTRRSVVSRTGLVADHRARRPNKISGHWQGSTGQCGGSQLEEWSPARGRSDSQTTWNQRSRQLKGVGQCQQ